MAGAGIAELVLVSLCHHTRVGDFPALDSPLAVPLAQGLCWGCNASVH